MTGTSGIWADRFITGRQARIRVSVCFYVSEKSSHFQEIDYVSKVFGISYITRIGTLYQSTNFKNLIDSVLGFVYI